MTKRVGLYLRVSTKNGQERIHAGLARAQEKGTRSGKPIGRAKIDPTREAAIRAARQGYSQDRARVRDRC